MIYVSVAAPNTSNIADYVCNSRVSGPYIGATPAGAPGAAVTGVSATTINATHIDVSWVALSPLTWGDRHVGYQIAFSRTVGQERADLSLAGTGSVVTGLSNSTAARMNTMMALPQTFIEYEISVVAVSSVGPGPPATGSTVGRTAEAGMPVCVAD